jgi:hypothetical protein
VAEGEGFGLQKKHSINGLGHSPGAQNRQKRLNSEHQVQNRYSVARRMTPSSDLTQPAFRFGFTATRIARGKERPSCIMRGTVRARGNGVELFDMGQAGKPGRARAAPYHYYPSPACQTAGPRIPAAEGIGYDRAHSRGSPA